MLINVSRSVPQCTILNQFEWKKCQLMLWRGALIETGQICTFIYLANQLTARLSVLNNTFTKLIQSSNKKILLINSKEIKHDMMV